MLFSFYFGIKQDYSVTSVELVSATSSRKVANNIPYRKMVLNYTID
jgi:hypothetical protein